jgi:hypothetical protein
MQANDRQEVVSSFGKHLVRDQGIGGSNLLSTTIIFNHLQLISGLPPLAVWAILRLRKPQKATKSVFGRVDLRVKLDCDLQW